MRLSGATLTSNGIEGRIRRVNHSEICRLRLVRLGTDSSRFTRRSLSNM